MSYSGFENGAGNLLEDWTFHDGLLQQGEWHVCMYGCMDVCMCDQAIRDNLLQHGKWHVCMTVCVCVYVWSGHSWWSPAT